MIFFWLKAFHFVGMISWFAGMFYIWRLFVYNAMSESADVKAQLNVMASKLYRIIMMPAMIVTLVCGGTMVAMRWEAYSQVMWIWFKVFFVGVLVGFHFLANWFRLMLEKGEHPFSHKTFRYLNEVPTICMFLIVFLAVFKPF
ncbi:MAG: CopD family protein [Spirochaetia bacterium]|nr:CopD family protein [Spirochaetia bacterium]